jgi:hypothetical protein
LGVLAQVLVMRAWVAIAQGSWASAQMLVDESGRLAEEVGQSWWRTGSAQSRSKAVRFVPGPVHRRHSPGVTAR